MYLFIVLGLMFVIPAISVLIEFWAGNGDVLHLVGKWFVFWAAGVRLLVAGISQALRPAFTAQGIFNIKDPEASKIVSELGFANISMGLLGVLSLFYPDWIVPVALCTGLFLGLDGIKHAANRGRSAKENVAMVTDLLIALILAIVVIQGLATRATHL